MTENEIAKALTLKAYQDGSTDNISVSVQTIKPHGQPASFMGMTGVYDGHGGSCASQYTAEHIGMELLTQLALSEEDYCKQPFSVQNNKAIFARDNAQIDPTVKPPLTSNQIVPEVFAKDTDLKELAREMNELIAKKRKSFKHTDDETHELDKGAVALVQGSNTPKAAAAPSPSSMRHLFFQDTPPDDKTDAVQKQPEAEARLD